MPEYPQTITHRLGASHGAAFITVELNPYGEGHCPECGADLSRINAVAEAGNHWGIEPLPVLNENYLARARRAVLLREPLPEE